MVRLRSDVTTRLLLLSSLPTLMIAGILWWASCTLTARVFVGQYMEIRSQRPDWVARYGPHTTMRIEGLNPIARWVVGRDNLPPITVIFVGQGEQTDLPLQQRWHDRLLFLLRIITAIYAAVILTGLLVTYLLLRVGVARPLTGLARRVRAYTELPPDDLVGQAVVRMPELDRRDEIGELARAFRDVSQSLVQAKYKVQRSEQFATYGEFAGGLAHELGNPLAVAMQEVYAAQHGSADGSFQLDAESGPAVREALRRVDGIVRGLQALYRGGAVDTQPLIVSDVLRAVQARFETGVLQVDGERDAGLTVVAHRYLLEQALYNLVRNAHQAQAKRGIDQPVSLAVRLEGSEAVFRIRDAGGGVRLGDDGLPVQDLTKQGMGLGLSLVARSVELMHGALRFSSTATGTEVSVSLPGGAQGV